MFRFLISFAEEMWMNYGTHILETDPERAAEIFSRARPRAKYEINRLTWLSSAQFRLGKVDDAIASIQHASELLPNDCDLHCRKATLLLHSGDVESAKACIGACLKIDPHFSEALEIQAKHLNNSND